MINSDDFIKRLQKVMDYYAESASSFSDKIGVQRSSISHILSGRNKPSLDFVLKILSIYPDVDLYWLLNGKGEFPSLLHKNHSDNISIIETTKPKSNTTANTPINNPNQNNFTKNTIAETTDKSIDKIVIFYKDGTFKDYMKNQE